MVKNYNRPECFGIQQDNDVTLQQLNNKTMSFLTPKELLDKYPKAKSVMDEDFIELLFRNDYLLGRFSDEEDKETVQIEESSFVDLMKFRDSVIGVKMDRVERMLKK